MPRILFVIPCTTDAPSGQRRVLDYLPYLRDAGITPVVKSYTSPPLYHCWMTKRTGSRNPFAHVLQQLVRYACGVGAYVSRGISLVWVLAAAPHYDGVVVQWLTPPAWAMRWLASRNSRLVFDFDDAVFLRHPSRTDALVRTAAVVAAGSHYNLDYARERNPNSVFLPTPVPVNRFTPRVHNDAGPVVIGWIGSISTLADLAVIAPALDAVAGKRSDVVLRIIGCGSRTDLIPEFEQIRVEVIPRIPYEDVPAAVARFDIGVMPLRETDWEKGKCLGKMLEYWAASVPAVVSRFGENVHAVTDGVDGYLASTTDEWVDKLLPLVSDRGLRGRIGTAGRKTAETRYATDVCARILIDDVLSRLT